MSRKNIQHRASRSRWYSIVKLSACVVFLASIMLHIARVDRLGKFLVERLLGLTLFGTLAAATLVASLVCLIAIGVAPLKPSHLRNSLRFPSIWVAVVIGCIGTPIASSLIYPLLSHSRQITFSDLDWAYATGLLVVSVLAALLLRWLADERPLCDESGSSSPEDSPAQAMMELPTDPEAIREWIRRESPIRDPTDDLLDHSTIARRMARLLLREDRQTYGLQGAYGTGKTGITNLIESYCYQIRNPAVDPEVWFCRVSCWGFHNSAGALLHILETSIDRIGEEVDVVSLRGIPNAYLSAVRGSGSKFGRLLAGI